MPSAARRRRARASRGAAVAALGLCAGGCGGSGGPDPAPTPTAAPRPPSDEQRIGRLLERRAERIGRAQRALGVRGARYEVERIAVRGRRARVRARLVYRVAGVRGELGSTRTLVARRAGGRWRLARPVGERDAEPWEVDDYRREPTEHFVVWAPEGVGVPAAALESGYARLREALARAGLRRRYLVVLARDGEAARRITRRIAGLEHLTALTDTQVAIGGPAERVRAVRSQRLIVVASAFGRLEAAAQEQVVTHELAHAVLAPRTSTRTPAWLTEGIALYLSADDRRAEFLALPAYPSLAALSEPDAIARLTAEGQRAGYATASAAAFLVADAHGPDALLELIDAYGSTRLGGDRGDPALTDRVLRRVLGVGLDELQRMLR